MRVLSRAATTISSFDSRCVFVRLLRGSVPISTRKGALSFSFSVALPSIPRCAPSPSPPLPTLSYCRGLTHHDNTLWRAFVNLCSVTPSCAIDRSFSCSGVHRSFCFLLLVPVLSIAVWPWYTRLHPLPCSTPTNSTPIPISIPIPSASFIRSPLPVALCVDTVRVAFRPTSLLPVFSRCFTYSFTPLLRTVSHSYGRRDRSIGRSFAFPSPPHSTPSLVTVVIYWIIIDSSLACCFQQPFVVCAFSPLCVCVTVLLPAAAAAAVPYLVDCCAPT